MEFSWHAAATPTETRSGASTAVKHLLLARSLRDFGDGFVALLLPVYLTALGLSPFEVGVVASVGVARLRSSHILRRLIWRPDTTIANSLLAAAVPHDRNRRRVLDGR